MGGFFSLLLFLVVVALPAWYLNRYLLRLIRPKESAWRFVAYVVVTLAAAMVCTAVVCVLLIKFVFER